MKVVAVTTFNADGYALYGKRMMGTFHKHWCCNVELHAYSEGWKAETDAPEIRVIDLNSSSDWLLPFKQRNSGRNRTDGFLHDAIRFSHKIAAILATAQDESLDYLIWLDGDIVTHTDFDGGDLESILPAWNEIIAWLDRKDQYPECGFYILNCRHAEYKNLIRRLWSMYVQDDIFNLKFWTDCHALEEVIFRLEVETKSLSGPAGFNSHHPLVNGPLGQWFDHLKGPRKKTGKSHQKDLRVARTEAYWRG